MPYHASSIKICPVSCMMEYMSHRESTVRPPQHASLFVENGTELTKNRFNYIIKQTMLAAGYNSNQFSTHSLRSGVATTAACNNFSDWELKKLGGWATNTYQSYIHINPRNKRNFTHKSHAPVIWAKIGPCFQITVTFYVNSMFILCKILCVNQQLIIVQPSVSCVMAEISDC